MIEELKIWQETGKRRWGVTHSKGTQAGSQTQVCCRASAHGCAVPTELNSAPACTNLIRVPFHFRCYRFIAPFFFQGGCGVTGASSYLMGEDQSTPWMSRQLIAGPLLMAEVATQEQFLGSVSCSRTLQHVAQFRPGEPGFEPVTFQSPVHQLYPLKGA